MTYTAGWVPAEFTRGGFPHERVYHVRAADGGEFSGMAGLPSCRDAGFGPLPTADPPDGRQGGFLRVTAYDRVEGGGLRVSPPDGEAFDLPAGVFFDAVMDRYPWADPAAGYETVGRRWAAAHGKRPQCTGHYWRWAPEHHDRKPESARLPPPLINVMGLGHWETSTTESEAFIVLGAAVKAMLGVTQPSGPAAADGK